MKWVRFKQIELKNYRQFISEKLEFSYKKNKSFNIILGRNGFGKSNLFNAITWCFYGQEKHLKKSKNEDMLPIINKAVAKKLKRGEIEEVKVILHLDSDEGPIKIVRSVNFRGVEKGLPYMDEKTSFSVMITCNNNWIESPGPNTVINRILPEEVSDFFFLDGEKLRQQFEEIDEKAVKNSIMDISQLNLLEKSMVHLGNIESEIRASIKSDDPKTDALEAEINFDEKQLKAIPIEIKKMELNKKEAQKNKKRLEQELRDSSSKKIKDLQLERDDIQEKLEEANEELNNTIREYNIYLIEVSHIIYCGPAIKKTLKVIDSLKKAGRIPAKIEQVFLKELLDKKECICGTNISSGKGRERLLKLLNEMDISSVSNDAIELKYNLKSKVTDLRDFKNKTDSFSKKIDGLEKKMKKNSERLNEIRTELKKYEGISENIEDKEKEIEEYEGAIENLIKDITTFERDEISIKRRLNEKKKDYTKLVEKNNKNKGIAKKLEFLNDCNEVLLKTKEELLTEIRKEIELDVQKNFTKNLITEKKIKEITINEDYKISVVTKEGYNTLKSLSAGETLCLALSFMAAFRNISGFAAPIIIDTPLAKIDEEYRENILNFLISSLKDTQITLLVMSSEYTDKVKKVIDPFVNEKHFINFDKDLEIANIIKK